MRWRRRQEGIDDRHHHGGPDGNVAGVGLGWRGGVLLEGPEDFRNGLETEHPAVPQATGAWFAHADWQQLGLPAPIRKLLQQ